MKISLLYKNSVNCSDSEKYLCAYEENICTQHNKNNYETDYLQYVIAKEKYAEPIINSSFILEWFYDWIIQDNYLIVKVLYKKNQNIRVLRALQSSPSVGVWWAFRSSLWALDPFSLFVSPLENIIIVRLYPPSSMAIFPVCTHLPSPIKNSLNIHITPFVPPPPLHCLYQPQWKIVIIFISQCLYLPFKKYLESGRTPSFRKYLESVCIPPSCNVSGPVCTPPILYCDWSCSYNPPPWPITMQEGGGEEH